MAALSPDQIRTFVYDHLDIESDEVPAAVLDIFMSDAYNRIVGYFEDSPTWLHVEYDFTTLSGQSEYDLDTYTGLTDPRPLQTIADVRGPRWSLRPVQHRQVREGYRQTTPSSGSPSEFSVWGRSLFLWTAPSSAEAYTVTGTRQPTDWLATNTVPDCPEEFHRLIADYTLGRAYAQQDDPELAALFLNAFLPAIQQLAKRFFDGSRAQPLIVHGGRGNAEPWRTQQVLGPLIYDWE